MSKSMSPSAACLLAALILVVSVTDTAHGRVSKSFVRGFLVGYAKGLEEGKNLVHLQPVVHSVACTFHPIPEPEPELHIPHHEPHHEPHHIGHHEPVHHPEPHHHHHHHEHGFSASNSHATNSAGQGHSTNLAASHVPPPQANGQIAGPQVGPNGPNGLQGGISDDKKAAATSAIEKAVKTAYKA